MSSGQNRIAETLDADYYAVIFTSIRTDDDRGYGQMADRMVRLASQMPGFLGVESVGGSDGLGITVSYWKSEDAIECWKAHSQHQVAQAAGKTTWYTEYALRVATVERAYGKISELAEAADDQR